MASCWSTSAAAAICAGWPFSCSFGLSNIKDIASISISGTAALLPQLAFLLLPQLQISIQNRCIITNSCIAVLGFGTEIGSEGCSRQCKGPGLAGNNGDITRITMTYDDQSILISASTRDTMCFGPQLETFFREKSTNSFTQPDIGQVIQTDWTLVQLGQFLIIRLATKARVRIEAATSYAVAARDCVDLGYGFDGCG